MVNLGFLTPTTFAFLGSSRTPSTTTTTPTTTSSSCRKRGLPFYSHSSVVSPYTPTPITKTTSSCSACTEQPESAPPDSSSLEELCDLLGVTPGVDLIRLESTPDDGVRGVYLNDEVQEGDLIVKVPLRACLLDDEPPQWWSRTKQDQQNGGDDEEFLPFLYNTPSDWAPRLAASLLDLQLNQKEKSTTNNNFDKGKQLWLSYLPNPDHLRASLPVHWSEDTLSSARCTALELAVDSAYFARAEAVADLVSGLSSNHFDPQVVAEGRKEELIRMCQNALDVVQTRSCRVEQEELGFPVRVLAPVFDLINHGSSTSSGGEGNANAQFGLEDDHLCVRAIKDIKADQEVLIDYGDSAKPAWKCLLSYGFVPQYSLPDDNNNQEESDDEEEDDDDDEQEGENVAEIFMDGHRYEVGPSTIPFDLVSAACAWGEAEEPQLTPEIALKLAKRISDVSLYLLLDDKKKKQQEEEEDEDDESLELDDLPDEAIEELISLQRAASLRWSQHRILQACAKGLQSWASQ